MKTLSDILNSTQSASYCSDEDLRQVCEAANEFNGSCNSNSVLKNIEAILKEADDIHSTVSTLKSVDVGCAEKIAEHVDMLCKAFAYAHW